MKKLFISMLAVSLISCALSAEKKSSKVAKPVDTRSIKKMDSQSRSAKYVQPVEKKVVKQVKEYKSNLKLFKERASN